MEQMAAAQLRLSANGRRHEMMAAFHSVPRDLWLETTIADIRALMGLPSSPQLDKFTRWFLFLAHLQHRLVGVTDNSKVLNYFGESPCSSHCQDGPTLVPCVRGGSEC